MHLVVCVKQVLDPEIPARDFAIDPATRRPVQGRAPLVISTFDEIALEVALKLREELGGGTVTGLTLGPSSADEVLRRAMAMQADAGVRVDSEGLDLLDPVATATALAEAVRQLEPVDAVLCGREAADTDGGQVGLLLAEMLGWPAVCNVILAHPGPQGHLRVEREAEDGTEVVEVALPAVLTATNADVNVPRIPRVKDVMMAHRKPIRVVPAQVPQTQRGWISLEDLYVPVPDRQCRFVEGDTVEAKVEALVRELRQMKVL